MKLIKSIWCGETWRNNKRIVVRESFAKLKAIYCLSHTWNSSWYHPVTFFDVRRIIELLLRKVVLVWSVLIKLGTEWQDQYELEYINLQS